MAPSIFDAHDRRSTDCSFLFPSFLLSCFVFSPLPFFLLYLALFLDVFLLSLHYFVFVCHRFTRPLWNHPFTSLPLPSPPSFSTCRVVPHNICYAFTLTLTPRWFLVICFAYFFLLSPIQLSVVWFHRPLFWFVLFVIQSIHMSTVSCGHFYCSY